VTSPESLVYVALIVAVSSLASVVLTSWMTGRQRHADKEEDWARQDAVAAQAVEAAQLLVESNKQIAARSIETNCKLDLIHTLVNSSMTAALTAERDSMVRELAMMQEIVQLKGKDGPTPVAARAITLTEARIAELNVVLVDRLKAAEVVADQAKVAAAKVDAT
jgi:hypothetical protein